MLPILKLLSAVADVPMAGEIKIHLASHTGEENPLDVYLADDFQEWQKWQTKKNFEREYVLSLIQMPGKDLWLFVGLYRSTGSTRNEPNSKAEHYYALDEDTAFSDLSGQLIVRFPRPGRQSYLNAERWVDQIHLEEIKSERMNVANFDGYRKVNISKGELDLIIGQSIDSWRAALSNVAGVYLISDKLSGMLYVGSASGSGGIWQRWCDYSATGHGGNKELKKLMAENGDDYASSFRYSILELADIHESADEIIARENHWKEVLLTRSHGLNAN
jgi:hypothetical protein